MNTYIAMNSTRKTQLFSTNNTTSEFEYRLWSSIAKLQDGERWLCLVAPNQLPSKAFLTSAGINVNRMLVVHTQSNSHAVESTVKALQLGKCAAVVSWLDDLTESQRKRIAASTEQGVATSLIIKQANESAMLQTAAA